MNTNTSLPNHTHATGPKTDDGKRIAARNATTHGLFARDVVLPHLGEDPAGYEALLQELTNQLQPKNLLEQHYTEKIAAASWRLRRLQRWQAQLFEDHDITEDQAMDKLDRVMRHETALHRQIDTSVRMLARELPKLFQDRVRAELIRGMNATEKDCREEPLMNEWIISETKRRITAPTVPPDLDLTRLDNAPPEPVVEQPANCQNELVSPTPPLSASPLLGQGEAGRGSTAVLPPPNVKTNLPIPIPVVCPIWDDLRLISPTPPLLGGEAGWGSSKRESGSRSAAFGGDFGPNRLK